MLRMMKQDGELCLHDCLSLGEVELGLAGTAHPPEDENRNNSDNAVAVRHRLPLLLRLLHESRPLSSVPSLSLEAGAVAFDQEEDDEGNKTPLKRPDAVEDDSTKKDSDGKLPDRKSSPDAAVDDDDVGGTIQRAVDRLEDAAASDPVAEAAEALVGAWAPRSARRFEKLLRRQLRHSKTRISSSSLNLHSLLSDTELEEALAVALSATDEAVLAVSPLLTMQGKKKRQRTSVATDVSVQGDDDNDDDGDGGSNSDAESDDDNTQVDHVLVFQRESQTELLLDSLLDKKTKKRPSPDPAGTTTTKSSGRSLPLRNQQQRRQWAVVGEDSHEASVTKTLVELVRLVRAHSSLSGSSARVSNHETTEDETAAHPPPSLVPEDSIFAQEEPRQGGGGGGAGASMLSGPVDLPSTVSALLHHAPYLPARSVAEAMCRAGVPQAPSIVSRIAANDPSATAGLIAGCLDSLLGHHHNHSHHAMLSLSAARGALRSLALLSPRELARVRSAISDPPSLLLLDLQLELALLSGPDSALEAACLVNQHFSCLYGVGEVVESEDNQSSNNSNGEEEEVATNPDHDDDEEEEQEDDEPSVPGTKLGPYHRGRKTSLQGIFHNNPSLLRLALEVFGHDLAAQRNQCDNDTTRPTARFSLVMTSVVWLLYKVPINLLLEKPTGRAAFESCLTELQHWVEKLRITNDITTSNHGPDDVPLHGHLDRSLKILVCSCFAALSASFSLRVDEAKIASTYGDASCKMLVELLLRNLRHRSHDCAGFAARLVLLCANRSDASSLMLGTLLLRHMSTERKSRNRQVKPRDQCAEACHRLCASFTPEEIQIVCLGGLSSIRSLVADPAFGLDLARDVMIPDNVRLRQLREMLEHVLTSTSDDASALLHHPLMPAFIETTVFALMNRGASSILPIVSPVEVENLSQLASFRPDSTLTLTESRFIVCLLYYFALRDVDPKLFSLFMLDFRTLPVTNIRYLCEKPLAYGMSESLASRLCDCIDVCCPETRQKASFLRLSMRSAKRHGSITKRELLARLRNSIESRDSDPSGKTARRAFIVAKGWLSESTLITSTTSALLSHPNTLPSFFTFASLYRDPLILLKCSTEVWQNRGLRSILVSLLQTLLTINDYAVKENAPSEDLRSELIDARNLLVFRSLVALMTTEYKSPSGRMRLITCPLTLGFIRRSIAKYPGLLAGMLKQGLADVAVDWLVDWVPECAADSAVTCSVLTERSSLGAPERLVVADSALRIAVMHGALWNDDTTRQLVLASLSQLISSFFLVLGPVGVPVSSIIGPGHDATMISRKAAFRMLKTMLRVQSFRPEVRKECCAAVQKLIGLCKGENIVAGLPGALASRQKKLIKELMDALTRASNALGATSV